MRALAVLFVFIFHCTVMADRPEGVEAVLIDQIWVHLTFLNGVGPLMFFGLSGFLITNILLKTKDLPHYFRNFYIRRGLRILPLYFAVVFGSLVVLPMLPSLFPNVPLMAQKVESFGGKVGDSWWTYLLLVHNWAIAADGAWRHGILDITWSIAVEEQYYVLWPMLVYAFSRRTLIRICFGFFVFALLFRCYLVFVANAHPIAAYVLTPARLGAPAVGCLLALIWRDEALIERLKKPCSILGVCTIPLIWLINWAEIQLGTDFTGEYGVRGGPIGRTVGDSIVALGIFSMLVCCIAIKPGNLFITLMSSRPLAFVARYSYGIFLFHMPIRAAIRDLIFGPGWRGNPRILFFDVAGSLLPAQMVFYVISFIPTLILAAISWHFFEKRFVEMKRFVKGEQLAQKSPDVPAAR